MTAGDPRREPSEGVEVPAPTAWPFVTAVGVAFGFAGVVTHAAVSAVGVVLALIGFGGWLRELFPREHTERMALRSALRQARPATTSRRSIEHLELGEGAHRVRVPVEVRPYSAGVKAGLAGGVAMAVVALIFGLLAQGSPWYPINLLAASAMPSMAAADLAQLRAFDAIALLVGIVVHGVVSILVGLLYAVILPTLPRYPIVWASLGAPLLWTALVWSTLGLVNPVLNERIEWRWFIASQIAFGLVAGWVIARTEPIRTMQTWPLAARAGIESPGVFEEKEDS